MKEPRIKKNMRVTISHDAHYTNKSYGVIGTMKGMKGGTYRVEDVWINSTYGLSARLKGFSWDAKDLTEFSTEKKPEPFHFDIKELRT